MAKTNATAVMFAATLAYVLSVFTRASLAVAAIPAQERFGVSAAALGALVVFQVMVYAAMQIPVGVLLDRYGARRLLLIGAIAMAVGQFVVANAQTIQFAYLGRILVGIGDAFTFVCMLRLIHDWNDSSRATRLQLFMTNIGQAGQIVAALPFAYLLAFAGWQSAFNLAALVSILTAVAIFAFIKPGTEEHKHHSEKKTLRESMSILYLNIRFSGTRMCFWIMFVSQSSGTVFALFWGVPFLIKGQGQTPAFASSMLVVQFVLGVSLGAVLGWIAIHRKHWRVRVFLIVGFGQVVCWLALGLLPGKAPVWLLVLVVSAISIGAPTSMIAMDFSRTLIPAERRGSANGFINVGGHLATFLMMALAGWVLDIVQQSTGSPDPFTFEGFRWAMSTQVVVLLFGIAMFWMEYRKTRMQLTE